MPPTNRAPEGPYKSPISQSEIPPQKSSSKTEPLATQYTQILAIAAGMPAGDAFDLRYLDEVVGRAMPAGALFESITALQLEPEG